MKVSEQQTQQRQDFLCGNLTARTGIGLETINPYGLAEIDTRSLDNFFYDAIMQFRSMLRLSHV